MFRPARSWMAASHSSANPPSKRNDHPPVDHSLGLVVEGGDDLVGVRFRVVKSQAADREIDDFMTVPRSRPG